MTGQQQTNTQADRRKRKFSFFANALLNKENKKELPTLKFLSGFLSDPLFAHCRPRSCGRQRANPSRKTKTPAKNYFLPARASWTVACFLTVLLSADNSVAQNIRPLSEMDKKQIKKNMANSGDWQRLNELEMLNVNFGNYVQSINEIYEQWRFTLTGLEVLREEQAWQMEQQNRQMTQKMGVNPPPTQADIDAEMKNRINGKPPALTAEQKQMQELENILNEIASINRSIDKHDYYNSEKYKADLPNYIKAKDLIKEMLEGKMTLSIKDAYFLAESAYGNLQLNYDEYNKLIKDNADFIRKWLVENGYNPQDPEAIHLGIQKFLSDSLVIGNGSIDKIQPKKQGHSPYYYDYIDNISAKDRKNYFVTKTLATGSGQCHTFPVTYLILAEALGVEVNLAYNPVHSFVQYKNNNGTVMNYETTVDRFLPDPFYLQTLPVMATAQKNDIYINSLSKKQVVASVLFDLAVNFILEHWLSDKTFIKECMNTATPYFPNQDYISTANDYLHKRLYADAFNSKVQEKGINDLSEIKKYPDVLEAYNNYRNYMEKISKLGIQDFPESEYLRLLEYYDYKGKLQIAKKIDAKSKKNLFFNK